MSEELKPCPFCLGKAELKQPANTRIECGDCGAVMPSGVSHILYNTFEGQQKYENQTAIKRWNRRYG